MMKLTYRDKVIVVALTVVLIIVLGAVFLVKPQISALKAKKADLVSKNQQAETIKQKIETLPLLQSKIIQSVGKIGDNQQPFFTEADGYALEQTVHQYCTAAGMTIDSMQFTLGAEPLAAYALAPSPDIISYDMKINADLYGNLPKDVMDEYNKVTPKAVPTQITGTMQLNITFDNVERWDDMKNFIDYIAGLGKTIYINELSSSQDPTETNTGDDSDKNVPTATCKLTLYDIYPMDTAAVIKNENDIALKNGTADALNNVIAQAEAAETTAQSAETTAAAQ
jgi:hypothetical protein